MAALIVAGDQLLKSWVVASFALGRPFPILGDWIQIDLIHNGGGLFGLVQGSAPVLGVVSLAVVVALVALEWRMAWRSPLLTLTIGLLLGGAIGNFIDRMRFGYVIDFADIGIGAWRFYVFNLADSAVTVALFLMLVVWIGVPWLEQRSGSAASARVMASSGEVGEGLARPAVADAGSRGGTDHVSGDPDR
jgi:signal peptidase II